VNLFDRGYSIIFVTQRNAGSTPPLGGSGRRSIVSATPTSDDLIREITRKGAGRASEMTFTKGYED